MAGPGSMMAARIAGTGSGMMAGGVSVLDGGFMMVLLDALAVRWRGILLMGCSGLGGKGGKTEEKHKNKCGEDGGRFHKHLGETLV